MMRVWTRYLVMAAVILMPLTAAAAAVTGKITDARTLLE